jgi:phosphoribosylformimino-5-aminoimidazole carboxamide ribotide isomerase
LKLVRGQPFEVIPVIDLQRGAVVRAHLGLRPTYAPIVTPLARTSTPFDVAAGFLRIHPFQTIYIADLDRIERRGSNAECIDELTRAFPALSFWVDAGIRDASEAHAFLARHERAHLVLGSESLGSLSWLKDFTLSERVALSLDYRGDKLLGPGGIWDLPELWPARVIVMTLAQVGSNLGPDFSRIAKVKRHMPGKSIYAAGGVRGAFDLMRLKKAGLSGVLIASALHDGRLTGADLAGSREGEIKLKGPQPL